MSNPFRSEAQAFRFLLVTVAAFALITAASLLGGAWVGVSVWAGLTVAAAAFYLAQRRTSRLIPTAPPHRGGVGERQILVVLDATAADETVLDPVAEATAGYEGHVLVICPARASQLDHWASAVDGALAESQKYVDRSLATLRAAGIEARGEVGAEDPLDAIEDALRTFGADSIIVVTPADTDDHPASYDVAAGARARFALPITRVVAGTGALVAAP